MVTKEDLLKWAEEESNIYFGGAKPIYSIMLFEYPNQEYVFPNGGNSGFPDFGANSELGFYHSLPEAIDAMNNNALDMRENIYNAGFILCKFPGLYNSAGTNVRMYFVWDDDKQGFYQQEEPEIFKHIAC